MKGLSAELQQYSWVQEVVISDNSMDTALKKRKRGKKGKAYLRGFRWVYTTWSQNTKKISRGHLMVREVLEVSKTVRNLTKTHFLSTFPGSISLAPTPEMKPNSWSEPSQHLKTRVLDGLKTHPWVNLICMQQIWSSCFSVAWQTKDSYSQSSWVLGTSQSYRFGR